MPTITTEHLDTVNQLELDAHTTADEATLQSWRAEVGVKANAADALGHTATDATLSERGVVATPAEQTEISSGDHNK